MSFQLTKNASIDYNTWSTGSRNFVLYGTAMIAASDTYSGTITITDASKNAVATWNLSSTSGTTSTMLGHVDVNPGTYKFPLSIAAAITVSGSSLDAITETSQKMGSKIENGNDVPISFETVIFFNNEGSDNDYDDCVLSFTLFNESVDSK